MASRRRRKTQVSINEAKSGLSKLIERVEAGEEILIARSGSPVAKLVGLKPDHAGRRLGLLDGKFKIPDDFNRPLPAAVLRAFPYELGKELFGADDGRGTALSRGFKRRLKSKLRGKHHR
jgi:prevent-host-death family protein